jgi:hypothetical protein
MTRKRKIFSTSFILELMRRRLTKPAIIRFGKMVGVAIIFLGVSYLLSLFSFYIYTKLSQVLQPIEIGFLGFAIIGLVAGLVAVLVSLVNKRLILTVVISFFIDCLIDSIFLYSTFGIQVIQFLPGLLAGMSAIIASWYFLRRKLGLFGDNETRYYTSEQIGKKYGLAQKFFENPDQMTLGMFKKACKLLQGIDPKIDAELNEADGVSRALKFLNGGDPIGFVLANISVKTKEGKKKKEKLLLFIDLVSDIREEVGAAQVRFEAARAGEYIGHHNTAAKTIIAASGTSGPTASVAIVVATAVIATNSAGIGFQLPKNDFQILKTQSSQEIIVPSPTAIPTILPTATPKTVQTLTYSTVEKTIFVSAPEEEGITYIAETSGTYRFTIISGAAQATQPGQGPVGNTGAGKWNSKIFIYKNRPVDFSGPSYGFGNIPANQDYSIGSWDFMPTFAEAENIGKGSHADINLQKGDYIVLLVFDSKGDFGDNSGGMYVQVQKGIETILTPQAVPEG